MNDAAQPSLEYTELPICPHCGREGEDDQEADYSPADGEEQATCGECGDVYLVQVFVTYRYTTRKVTP